MLGSLVKKPRCNSLISIRGQRNIQDIILVFCAFTIFIHSIYLCYKSCQIIWIFTQHRNIFLDFLKYFCLCFCCFLVLFGWVLGGLFVFFFIIIFISSVWTTASLDTQTSGSVSKAMHALSTVAAFEYTLVLLCQSWWGNRENGDIRTPLCHETLTWQ